MSLVLKSCVAVEPVPGERANLQQTHHGLDRAASQSVPGTFSRIPHRRRRLTSCPGRVESGMA